jgi:hypothetical protein
MKSIDELRAISRAADDVLNSTQDEKNRTIRELVRAAEKQISAEQGLVYDARIDALRTRAVAARSELNAALEELAVSGTNAPMPIGTRLVQWDYRGWNRVYNKTGVIGVVEAVTRNTVHPDNKAAYQLAGIGSFIIRHLKKDGSPSKKYDRWGRGSHSNMDQLPWGWYPEGVNPNQEKLK